MAEVPPISPEEYERLREEAARAGFPLPPPIHGAAAVPLAAMLIPMIPGLVNAVVAIVGAVKNDPGVPEAQIEKIALLSDRLNETAAAVAALEIRDLPGP